MSNTALSEEEQQKLLIAQQKQVLSGACSKVIDFFKDDLIYPEDDEINIYNDESCQKSLTDKIKLCCEKDGLYGSSDLYALIESAIITKEYTPDALYGGSDSNTAEAIFNAINADIKSSGTSETYELIKTYADKENSEEVKNEYSDDNLFAKQLACLPIDENGIYQIPRVEVGHIVFTPSEGNEKLNFRTIYKWIEINKVSVDWKTGDVIKTETNEKIGTLTEYQRGYNDKELIEDVLYQQDREKDSWNKTIMINSSTGESEEYDYLGRQINKDKPPKIRIVGIKTLLEDEEKYENEMLNRALCNCGGSTYALDKQIEEAATGYKEMLSDWMTRDEFNNKPQESLANGF